VHDDTVIESQSPAIVGLAIKDMQASNINRGDLICPPSTIEVSPEKLHANFRVPFLKKILQKIKHI
jgi:translation elongation factor EF-1alpha